MSTGYSRNYVGTVGIIGITAAIMRSKKKTSQQQPIDGLIYSSRVYVLVSLRRQQFDDKSKTHDRVTAAGTDRYTRLHPPDMRCRWGDGGGRKMIVSRAAVNPPGIPVVIVCLHFHLHHPPSTSPQTPPAKSKVEEEEARWVFQSFKEFSFAYQAKEILIVWWTHLPTREWMTWGRSEDRVSEVWSWNLLLWLCWGAVKIE